MISIDPFETIVSDHYQPLFRFAMSLTRVECDARDLTQQTFYLWAAKGHQLRDGTKVKAWLFTTLYRAFFAIRRRQVRFPAGDPIEGWEQIPSPECEPAEDVAHDEVLGALAQLNAVFRAPVALFYLENCSYKDIAQMLELPVGTVKSRIARGIAQLRSILVKEDSAFTLEVEHRSPPEVPARQAPRGAEAPDIATRDYSATPSDSEQRYDWNLSSISAREPLEPRCLLG